MLLNNNEISYLLAKDTISSSEARAIIKTALNETNTQLGTNEKVYFFSLRDYLKSDVLKENFKVYDEAYDALYGNLATDPPVGIIQVWHNKLLKMKLSLQKVKIKFYISNISFKKLYALPTYAGIVFFDKCLGGKAEFDTVMIISFLETMQHELYHVLQRTAAESFGLFFNLSSQACSIILTFEKNWYLKHHPLMPQETVADYYGVNATNDFLSDFPSFYAKHEQYLTDSKIYHSCLWEMLDFDFIFQRTYKIWKRKSKACYRLYEWFGDLIFEDPLNAKFKDINSLKDMLDPLSFQQQITTTAYLKQLKISRLSKEELETLLVELNYVINELLKKVEIINNNFNDACLSENYKSCLLNIIKPIIKQLPYRIKFLIATRKKVERVLSKVSGYNKKIYPKKAK